MKLDLSILKAPPDFTARALLTIDALAPLSMVVKMPGKYYRGQPQPSDMMLFAMLENALGWHIAEKERNDLLKKLEKRHKSPTQKSNVGFGSLLQWHVRFATRQIPPSMHYDDLWAQHLRGSSFADGSRNYDESMIPLMNAKRAGKITVGDTADAKRDPELLRDFQEGDKINIALMRPHFPQYYASPTPREYIVPEGPFRYRIETSSALLKLIGEAVESPLAPLYLGSNDGWVEASWEVING
jgi:CRISPR-associated protein Cas5